MCVCVCVCVCVATLGRQNHQIVNIVKGLEGLSRHACFSRAIVCYLRESGKKPQESIPSPEGPKIEEMQDVPSGIEIFKRD